MKNTTQHVSPPTAPKKGFDRKAYGRLYARKKRLAKWAAKAMQRTTCPATIARGRICRAPLENRVVNGVTVPFCPQCDRKRRGICIHCASPVKGAVGRAIFCEGCIRERSRESSERYKRQNRRKVLAYARKREAKRRADPIQGPLRRARKWAADVVCPSKKRRRSLRWSQSERCKEYRRAYFARPEVIQRERERKERERRGEQLTHPCLDCGAAISGRPKKCATCRANDRALARAIAFHEQPREQAA